MLIEDKKSKSSWNIHILNFHDLLFSSVATEEKRECSDIHKTIFWRKNIDCRERAWALIWVTVNIENIRVRMNQQI